MKKITLISFIFLISTCLYANADIIDDIVVNANISEVGFNRSFGVMVNYLYELKSIEKKIDRLNQVVEDEAKHTRLNANFVTPSEGGMSPGRCAI